MLDVDGFVAETNATNLFCARGGRVLTPTAVACLPGITRGLVIELCQELSIPIEGRRISLAEFHAADEVFTTGTMVSCLRYLCESEHELISRHGS